MLEADDRFMALPRQEKLSSLELVRFGAAFAVLVAHYVHFYVHGYAAEGYVYGRQPLFWLLGPFYHYGTRAVEVFWILSGFIFFHRYGLVIQQRKMPALRFLWLRFSRLYPLHFLTLVTVALLQWAYRARFGTFFVYEMNDLRHFVLSLFFASYWGFQHGFSFNAPSWSVSVEILAYLFFFVITSRFGASFFTVLLCLAASAGLNLVLGAEPVINRCIFYFYAGGLSWLVYRQVSARPRAWRLGGTLAGLAAIAACTRRFEAVHNLDFVLNFEVPVVLFVLALNTKLLGSRLSAAADALGNLTYASYLIHFPIQLAIMLAVGLLGIKGAFAASPLMLIAYLAGVLALSHVVYTRIEYPAQEALRLRLANDPSPAGAGFFRALANAFLFGRK